MDETMNKGVNDPLNEAGNEAVATVDGAVDRRARLAAALKDAMRARDRVAVTALRGLSARWANAEAVPVDVLPRAGAVEAAAIGAGAADAPRRELSDADLRNLATAEIAEHEQAAAEREALGRTDEAQDLRRQAQIIAALLSA